MNRCARAVDEADLLSDHFNIKQTRGRIYKGTYEFVSLRNWILPRLVRLKLKLIFTNLFSKEICTGS